MTTDPTVINKIIREQNEQLYTQKFDNSEEIDQYLKNYKLSKLSKDETVNLYSPFLKTEHLI